ncbi:PAP/fibrillin family protein [filamentous cyanobacterium LEGE 11480]|uniref:PAP/fibrillin family protein n=1 Tax=Romeriopsis navalis LEGE 11480 TaxID=2777977 RepID=A0A928VRI1_9CYAN|nr:PAP/fibrillin family protein [Romeriopsis navalis]MBE9033180.1 PAP/fibrillin family protein [Romeriopsis navalis LEGE 11480]
MLEKAALLERLADCNRGITATPEERVAIAAAIAQLEDRNPNPNPLNATALLEGDWQLLYTTSGELLGIDRIPLLNLGAIYQCIRTADSRIYNIAEVKGIPFLEGIISVVADFTPVTEQRVEVQFTRAIWGSQRLMSYKSCPQFIQSIESGQKFIALDFGIKPRERNGWLDITYLDADLRIGRGNVGSLFVLKKV